jgi:hypothetical protein
MLLTGINERDATQKDGPHEHEKVRSERVIDDCVASNVLEDIKTMSLYHGIYRYV